MINTKNLGVLRWILKRGGTKPLVANYNTAIKRGLLRAGIPANRHHDVLSWAIGNDYYDLSIDLWPQRLRKRLNLKVDEDQTIVQVLHALGDFWLKTHNI